MEHRGEIVRKRIKESGYKITHLSTMINMSKRTLERRLLNPKMDFDTIIEIGKVIHYDFGNDFKKLRTALVNDEDIFDSLPFLRKKVFELTQEVNQLMRENSELKESQKEKKTTHKTHPTS